MPPAVLRGSSRSASRAFGPPRSEFQLTRFSERARRAERPSPAHRCTRFASRVSSSRRKSSSPPRASGCRSATTPARLRRRMSLGHCSRSGLPRNTSAWSAGSTSCWTDSRRPSIFAGAQVTSRCHLHGAPEARVRGSASSFGFGRGDGGELTGRDGLAALGSANPATGGKGGTRAAGGAFGLNAANRSATATAGTLGAGGNGASGGISGGGGGGGGLYGGGGGGSEFEWVNTQLGGGRGGGGSGSAPAGRPSEPACGGSYGIGRATITYDRDTGVCE